MKEINSAAMYMVVKCIFLCLLLVLFTFATQIFIFIELKLLDFFFFGEYCSLSFLFCSDLATPPADTHARPTVTGLCKVIRARLEKAMAPHSSTLAWKTQGRRSLVGCSPWDRQESDTTEQLHFHFSLSRIGEGNGNPLQCSCLENPRDGGAW